MPRIPRIFYKEDQYEGDLRERLEFIKCHLPDKFNPKKKTDTISQLVTEILWGGVNHIFSKNAEITINGEKKKTEEAFQEWKKAIEVLDEYR